MIELSLRPCTQRIPPLPGAKFNTGFARAVIEDLVDGWLWVDRSTSPRVVHALHPYGMSLVWGPDLGAVVDGLAAHLREGSYRTREEWLQIDPRWEHLDWNVLLQAASGSAQVASSAVQRFHRVNFQFDRTSFLARHGRVDAPGGCKLRAMGAADFDIPRASVVPSAFWRNAAQFLAHGGGWCLEQDGRPAAFAFTSYRFDHELEIGVETMPEHRGKGYALVVAAAMVQAALAAGLTPVWSCRQENVASVRLAERLGFGVARVGPYFRLPASRHA